MDRMTSTEFFRCDRCHAECRVDSEAPGSLASTAPRTSAPAALFIRHCRGSEGIAVLGKPIKFQEKRGGLWVDVQPWVSAA